MNNPNEFPFNVPEDSYLDEELALSRESEEMASDYDWAVNDPAIREKFQGHVVAVHRRQVLGHGKDHGSALRNARLHPNAPRNMENRMALVPIVGGLRIASESNGAAPAKPKRARK